MSKKIDGGTVVIEGKADLKDIIKEGNKAGKALDNTKKSAQSADRQLKGAARASSGASKNFSKMSQGITGGLVPAYATLAANLFALDAVFRFLKDSADFRVLKEGQMAFAGATGIAYESLARDLQTATKGMISFREAAQAGAIGRAAGLSAGQLKELSAAAYTVSIALGRDVTDSFNRLIRGVTKAEPELLDELGIILRLEEATVKYAAALGLNKNQLSIYQKSQAVVNEVLDQAEAKFGKINAIMDPQANAIAQLGVAFEEAIDKMRPMIAFFAEGIAKFGKANIDVITVAIIGFAGGIIKSVLPAQAELAEKQRISAEYYSNKLDELRIKQDQLAASKRALANTPIAQQNLVSEMDSQGVMFGGQIGKDLREGKQLSGQQIGNLKSQQSRGVGVFANMTKAQNKVVGEALDDMKKNGGKMSKSVKLSLKSAGVSLQAFGATASKTGAQVSSAFSRIGSAAMNVFSKLMMWTAILSVVYMFGKLLLNFFTKPTKAQEAFDERMEASTRSISTFNGELAKMREVRAQGLIEGVAEGAQHTAEAFASADLKGRITEFTLLRKNAEQNTEAFDNFTDELAFTFKSLGEIAGPEAGQKFIQASEDIKNGLEINTQELLIQADAIKSLGASFKNLTNLQGEFTKAQNRIVQALPKIEFQDIVLLLEQQRNEYELIAKTLPQYAGDLELVTAQLGRFNQLRERGLYISMQENDIKRVKQIGFLLNRREKANLAINEKKIAVLKAEHTMDVQINSMEKHTQGIKTQAMQDQVKLLKDQVATAEEALEVEKIRQSLMASTAIKVRDDLTKDLGKAIGAGLRGDSSLFKNIGENMVRTITDAIGQKLSEDMVEAMTPEFLKGKTLGEEILDAGETHAKNVKEGIEDGAYYHASELARVTDSNTATLRQLSTSIVSAQVKVNQRKLGEEATRNARLKAESENLKFKTDSESLIKFKETEQFKTEADAYLQKTLGTADRRVLMDADDRKAKENSIVEGILAGKVNLKMRNKAMSFSTTEFGSAKDEYGGIADRRVRESSIRSAAMDEYYDTSKMSLEERTKLASEYSSKVGDFGGVKRAADNILATAGEKYFAYLEENMINNQQRQMELTGMPGTTDAGIIGGSDAVINSLKETIGEAGAGEDGEGGSGLLGSLSKLQTKTTNIVDGIKDPAKTRNLDADGNPIANTDPGEDGQKGQTEFQQNLTRFGATIGAMGALTGKEEATAKIMAKVAKIQLMISMYEQAKLAFEKGSGPLSIIKHFMGFGGTTGGTARQGGIMSKHGRSYGSGGVASGPKSGYLAELHGREAVVPLPNGRSIPVDIGKGKMATNNTNITVNVGEGGTDTRVDADGAAELATVINMAVQERLEKEMRPGGILGA